MSHYLHTIGHASPWLLAAAGIATLAPTMLIAYLLRRVLRGKKAADTLTVIAAAMASSVAATGMWHFFTRTMHLPVWIQAVLFAFMEVAVLASALRARANVAREGNAGADGLAVWVLTFASGFMSATEATSPQEALVRLGAPLVAAWLWERSMVPQRRARRAAAGRDAHSAFAKIRRTIRERFLASLGITAPDQSALEIRQGRAMAEAVRLTNRLETFEARFMAARRRRRLARRRDAAFLASGAPGDSARKQMILERVADIRYGDLENLELPSTWAAQVDELTRATAPAEAVSKEPQDRPVTVQELPAILAAALLIATQSRPALVETDRIESVNGHADLTAALSPSGPLRRTGSTPETESSDPTRTESHPADRIESDSATRTESGKTDRIETKSNETESGTEPRTESEGPTKTQSTQPARTKSTRTASTPTADAGARRNGPPPRTEEEMQDLVLRAHEALAGKQPTTEAIRVALRIGKNVAADVKRRLLANPNPVRTQSRSAQLNPLQTESADADRIESDTDSRTEFHDGTQTQSTESGWTEFPAEVHTDRTQSTAPSSFDRPVNNRRFAPSAA